MGQNNSKEYSQYNSKDYFNSQIEFYRWRADPLTNTHICRVSFDLQQSIEDREKLKSLLQQHFSEGKCMSLNQIARLADQTRNQSKEQLMSFQSYVCTLAELEERLTLQETLYTLNSLFCGYEVLLAKLGRLKSKLSYCLVTAEGEVRAWFNEDFKSNENIQERNEIDQNYQLINSEMRMIKRILEFGQKLASNLTEFLHFSRQLRFWMQRDILQNWTFINARKLINSYVYTYRITLPCNLNETLKRRVKSPAPTDISSYNSQIHYANSGFVTNKAEFMSTGDTLSNNTPSNNVSSCRREISQRPASLSEFSSKRSEQLVQNVSRVHSRKFSSIDLKHINDRSRQFDSSNVRSDVISHHSYSQDHGKSRKEISFHVSSQKQFQKYGRERQYAMIGEFQENKQNTTQAFTPHENKGSERGSDGNAQINKYKEEKLKSKEILHFGPMKQQPQVKNRKKLEKKTSVVPKYISFYQQTKNLSRNDFSAPNISPDVVRECEDERSNQAAREENSQPNNIRMDQKPIFKSAYPLKITFGKRQTAMPQYGTPTYSPPISRKASFAENPYNSSFVTPLMGAMQPYKIAERKQSENQSSHLSTHHREDLTIKTIGKLVDNNDLQIHESVGSLMSIEQSDISQYKGALCKMGRSVDLINLASNKQVLMKKLGVASNLFSKTYVNY